jgi:hypothetical protein
MTIERYLAELEWRLPRLGRRRILTEVEEHLRDSAARHEANGRSPVAAEAAATHDFGDVRSVAPRLAEECAVVETRAASLLALGAVAFFVFPLYVVPENTLPPATWTEKPFGIQLLQVVSVTLWVAAGTTAFAAAALAWSRWARVAAPLLELALRTLAGSIGVSVLLVAHWIVSASVVILWPLLAGPVALGCLYACAEAAGWAHSRRCRLVRH